MFHFASFAYFLISMLKPIYQETCEYKDASICGKQNCFTSGHILKHEGLILDKSLNT